MSKGVAQTLSLLCPTLCRALPDTLSGMPRISSRGALGASAASYHPPTPIQRPHHPPSPPSPQRHRKPQIILPILIRPTDDPIAGLPAGALAKAGDNPPPPHLRQQPIFELQTTRNPQLPILQHQPQIPQQHR